jgi:hypothetical protein
MNTTATAEQKVQTFERTLGIQISHKERADREFRQAATEHGALYAIEWGRQYAETIAQAELWETVAYHFNDNDNLQVDFGEEEDLTPRVARAIAAIHAVLYEIEKQLLRNWVRKSSTDEFSNAVSGARANGAARFHEEATGMLKFLTADEK